MSIPLSSSIWLLEVKIVFLWFDHHDQAYEKAYYVLEKTALNYPDLLANDGYPERYKKDDEP